MLSGRYRPAIGEASGQLARTNLNGLIENEYAPGLSRCPIAWWVGLFLASALFWLGAFWLIF